MRKKRRRLKKKSIFILILLIIIGIAIYGILNRTILKTKKSVIVVPKVVKKEIYPKKYSASLFAVGDSLIHGAVYTDAYDYSTKSYDFKPMLTNLKEKLKNYDLKYYNQETILGGTELGLSSYPLFNSPQEAGDAFLDAGFNLVSLATNHTMDKYEPGITNSLKYWKEHSDIVTAGSYSSFEERDNIIVHEINGIKYAFLNYTMIDNGLKQITGKEYYWNIYSEELAKKNIESVKDKVDVIIVAMHWGVEYNHGYTDEQEQAANYLASLGVNIIIGNHPHVIEPITFINNTLVIYSLGNCLSAQLTTDQLTGGVVTLDINKTVNKDKTSTISIDNVKTDLIYTYKTPAIKNFKIYFYNQLNNNLLYNYESYYQQEMSYFGTDARVTKPALNN